MRISANTIDTLSGINEITEDHVMNPQLTNKNLTHFLQSFAYRIIKMTHNSSYSKKLCVDLPILKNITPTEAHPCACILFNYQIGKRVSWRKQT